MAKVFANDMVAHVWAQQNQDSGRSHNGNYSFDGRVLYSYTTAIARFTEDASGRRVALVTSRTYSQTTSSKHMPPIWRALRGSVYFRVPDVGAVLLGGRDHARNLAYLVEQFREAERRFRGRRKVYAQDVAAHIREWLGREWAIAMDYAEAFGLERPADLPADFTALDVLAAEIAAMREQREAARNTPEAIAKREVEAAKRAERKERAEAEARRVQMLKDSERRAEWLAGGRIHYRGTTEAGGAFLRVMGDKLETSQGAVVPLADAIKVFRFVKLCRERGEGWTRNGARIPVGGFQVDRIDASGNFKAGCHFIEWPEIVSAATMAGVLDMEPDAGAVNHA